MDEYLHIPSNQYTSGGENGVRGVEYGDHVPDQLHDLEQVVSSSQCPHVNKENYNTSYVSYPEC